MATLESRQTAITSYVEARLVPNVSNLQATYLSTHGGYFQGVWTHDAPVPDGGESAPDLSRKPVASERSNGLAHTWAEAGAANLFPGNGAGAMDARVAVDEYVGPLGDGYVIRAQIEHGGEVYERAWSVGPHGWPTGWRLATLEAM